VFRLLRRDLLGELALVLEGPRHRLSQDGLLRGDRLLEGLDLLGVRLLLLGDGLLHGLHGRLLLLGSQTVGGDP